MAWAAKTFRRAAARGVRVARVKREKRRARRLRFLRRKGNIARARSGMVTQRRGARRAHRKRMALLLKSIGSISDIRRAMTLSLRYCYNVFIVFRAKQRRRNNGVLRRR